MVPSTIPPRLTPPPDLGTDYGRGPESCQPRGTRSVQAFGQTRSGCKREPVPVVVLAHVAMLWAALPQGGGLLEIPRQWVSPILTSRSPQGAQTPLGGLCPEVGVPRALECQAPSNARGCFGADSPKHPGGCWPASWDSDCHGPSPQAPAGLSIDTGPQTPRARKPPPLPPAGLLPSLLLKSDLRSTWTFQVGAPRAKVQVAGWGGRSSPGPGCSLRAALGAGARACKVGVQQPPAPSSPLSPDSHTSWLTTREVPEDCKV